MNASNQYGVKPTFVNTKSREKFNTYLLDRTAGDVAADFQLTLGATASLRRPVPGCIRDFNPSARVSDFYAHLENPVHWVYYDENGLQCGFGCGRGFANAACLYRHISENQCDAVKVHIGGDATICPMDEHVSCRR